MGSRPGPRSRTRPSVAPRAEGAALARLRRISLRSQGWRRSEYTSRGALVEPLSIGVHAVRLAGPRLGARLLILGCGTIGLSCCLVARSLGFARIVCTDADAAKGKLAAGAGADVFPDAGGRVVEEALLALGGDADVTIVPSGHSRALQEATEVTRPGGEVIVVSFFGGPAPVPLDDVVRRESSVRGACLSTPVDFTDALDWIAKGTIDPLW